MGQRVDEIGHGSNDKRAFMEWLDDIVQVSPEARRAEHEERLMLHLGDALRSARVASGMTQTMVSEASGLKQSVVSRLEKADHNPTMETLLRYLAAVDADLVLSIVASGHSYPATKCAERAVLVPESVVDYAEAQGVTTREYVLACLQAARSIEAVHEAVRDVGTDREALVRP